MLKRLSVTNNVARLRVPCSVVTMVMNEVSYDIIGVADQSRQGLSHAQCPEAVSRVLHIAPMIRVWIAHEGQTTWKVDS